MAEHVINDGEITDYFYGIIHSINIHKLGEFSTDWYFLPFIIIYNL